MRRRVAHLSLPQLSLDLTLQAEPQLRTQPVTIVTSCRQRLWVQHANAPASACGVQLGMTLADASAICPSLQAFPVDHSRDRHFLLTVAQQCQAQVSPWIGVDSASAVGAGGLFIDCTGCSHRLGGEEALVATLSTLPVPDHMRIRVAVADTPGAAWAWTAAGPTTPYVLAPNAQRQGLAPLPVHALRLDAATASALAYLGITTIGALLALPRPAITDRFGRELSRRLDQVMGQAHEQIAMLPQFIPHTVATEFLAPITTAEGMAHGLRLLCQQLTRLLESRRLGGCQVRLAVTRIDKSHTEVAIGTACPTRAVDHLTQLFAPKLERVDPWPGIERMQLTATEVARMPDAPPGLIHPSLSGSTARSRNPVDTPFDTLTVVQLAPLIDRLVNRLGAPNVTWVDWHETHVPEQRPHYPAASLSPNGTTPNRPLMDEPDRPVRLFHPPQPVHPLFPQSNAQSDQAIPHTIIWSGRTRRLVRISERERIVPPWWSPTLTAETKRDYYRVEDDAGCRLWLLRTHHPAAVARWWVHGLFG